MQACSFAEACLKVVEEFILYSVENVERDLIIQDVLREAGENQIQCLLLEQIPTMQNFKTDEEQRLRFLTALKVRVI
jgi:hypothetical protein